MEEDFNSLYFDDYESKGVRQTSDSRLPRISLKHLNKLKKIKAVRKLDDINRRGLLTTMYGQSDEGDTGL